MINPLRSFMCKRISASRSKGASTSIKSSGTVDWDTGVEDVVEVVASPSPGSVDAYEIAASSTTCSVSVDSGPHQSAKGTARNSSFAVSGTAVWSCGCRKTKCGSAWGCPGVANAPQQMKGSTNAKQNARVRLTTRMTRLIRLVDPDARMPSIIRIAARSVKLWAPKGESTLRLPLSRQVATRLAERGWLRRSIDGVRFGQVLNQNNRAGSTQKWSLILPC